MNDAEAQVQKDRVQPLIERWQTMLGLAGWHLEITWSRKKHSSDGRAMSASGMWQYRQGHVRVYLPMVKPIDDDRLEWVVVHELMHVMVEEMRPEDADKVEMAEERVCSQLASAFIWTRNLAAAGGDGSVTMVRPEPVHANGKVAEVSRA